MVLARPILFPLCFLFFALPPLCADPRTASGAEHFAKTFASVRSEARSDRAYLDADDVREADAYLREFEASAPTVPPEPLRFSRACEPGRRIVVGAVGDVLLHKPLAVQGMAHAEGFRSLWREVLPWMTGVDAFYANFEGPAAGAVGKSGAPVADPGKRFDDVAYTSYPMFNYHPDLVPDLRASGVDVVSTSNNHSLDRRALGADRTIEFLEKHGLPYTGTRTRAAAEREPPAMARWSTVTDQDGIRIAWLACTYGTNGIADTKKQVLHCFSQRAIFLDEIRRLRADASIDVVAVTPHWGAEYQHVPGADQRKLAREAVDAGADLLFGAHPHVLQPAEKIVAADGREAYAIYSLGNFVSGQKGLARRAAAIVFVGVTKNARGEVFVNGARHLPIVTAYGREIGVAPAKGRDAEARTLANRILASSRELAPDEPVVTNPECASR